MLNIEKIRLSSKVVINIKYVKKTKKKHMEPVEYEIVVPNGILVQIVR